MGRNIVFILIAVFLPFISQASSVNEKQPISTVNQKPLVALSSLITGSGSVEFSKLEVALSTKISARSVAAPLTNMWVYAIGSSNYGGWEITAGQASTSFDHGGMQLRAVVLEVGYGNMPVASINGWTLPSSAMYSSTMVCQTGASYYWPCNAGDTVVGFLRAYNLDGYQGGQFKYQNTSTNSPWNSLSTQINIQ